MARVFITGSADGLGQLAAQQLVKEGHQVVLHARSQVRARDALTMVPGAEKALAADLSSLDQTRKLAVEVNQIGTFDAIIHNAGVYQADSRLIFFVNTLAPYILTCLTNRPKRLIYLSSGLHSQGRFDHNTLDVERITYADSKLHVNILTMAVARKWPDVYANAVNPGWVPTKMGGAGAPDSLQKGYETQVWLATSDDPEAKVSGQYFFHKHPRSQRLQAQDSYIQEDFLAMCKDMTGIALPTE